MFNSSKNKFSKESVDYFNKHIDGQDPQELAHRFLAILRITKLMADEFREMYPHHHDANVKVAFRQGFEGMKSDSADFVLNHSFTYPVTIAVFFDSQIYLESIIENLANKILEVFIFKFEHKLIQGSFKDFTPTNQNYNQIGQAEKHQSFDFSENPGTTFESALPIIFEDTLVDYIK